MSSETFMPPAPTVGASFDDRDGPPQGVGSTDLVLRASGLVHAFGGQRVLDGIDLSLRCGEVVLLRGENGSGKTTLLNILTGNLAPDAGVIEYFGPDARIRRSFPTPPFRTLLRSTRFSPELVAGLGIGRTWQDVRLFQSQSLRDNIAVADRRSARSSPVDPFLRPREARRRDTEVYASADEALASLGLGDRLHSSGDMISLGQSKRVAIARAVAAGARALLLDEPLAGLDRRGIEEVVRLLESLIARAGISLILVEHAFSHVHLRGIVSTDWYLSDGKLATAGGAHGQRAPGPPRPFALATMPIPKLQAWSDFQSHEPGGVEQALPRAARVSHLRAASATTERPSPALEVENLIVRRGQRVALGLDDQGEATGFNLRVEAGEVVLLRAPNGWGKTTLFEAICGTLPVAGGAVRIGGVDVTGLPPWDRWRAGLTASASGARLFGTLAGAQVAQLARLHPAKLDDVSHLLSKRLDDMSGGERQRTAVSIAMELARSRPGILLLDEPLAMLDTDAIRNVLVKLGALPCAVLILDPATN